jgi:hypothetical protein
MTDTPDMPENLLEFLTKLKDGLPANAPAPADPAPAINTGFLDDMKRATEQVANDLPPKDRGAA